MSLNLLNGSVDMLSQLDWDVISNDLQNQACLNTSKEEIVSFSENLTIDSLNSEYDIIESKVTAILEDTDQLAIDTIEQLASYEEKLKTSVPTLLKRLEKGAVLRLAELNPLIFAINNYFLCLKYFSKKDFDHNLYQKYQKNLIKPFRSLVDLNGHIKYESHSQLREIYEKIISTEDRIRQKLEFLIRSELYANAIQIENHDNINDRYVLLVKSDSYQAKMGQIISHSESGRSLYVEPFEVQQLCYKRNELKSELDQIINNFCIQFSSQTNQEIHLVRTAFFYIEKLDLSIARAKFCLKHKLFRPTIVNDQTYRLNGLFHPLIENCIRNNIELFDNKKGLIISGPNTGGKTVTLKSFALCSLLLRLNLFIPAINAELPLCENIYYLSNDQQNLTAGLSSFSGEVKNYMSIIDELRVTGDSKSLIIIDEIFNSTSSEEASALAMSLLEEIHNLSNSKVIISTHHQMLKTYMHGNKEYQSAHVGYDLENNKATYKIINDLPGSSMAITIFEQLAKNSVASMDISYKAKNILDKKMVEYESLLEDVSKKNRELTRLIEENVQLNKELKNQKDAADGILQLKVNKLYEKQLEKVDKVFKQAQSYLEKVKSGEVKNNKTLEKHYHALKSELKSEDKYLNRPPPKNLMRLKNIKEGETYFSYDFNDNVTVKSIDERRSEVVIMKGVMQLKTKNPKLTKAKKNKNQKVETVFSFNAENIKTEVDCRGMRLDEFEKIVDQQINYLLADTIPFTTIIHGHGDGVLKKHLKKVIKLNNRLSAEDAHQGNDGATTIKLR